MKADEAAAYRRVPPVQGIVGQALEFEPPHEHALESIRTASHKGHEIVIKTTYEITVDGKPLTSHVMVGNDGKVHSHDLPNYVFFSTVELIKKLIDFFPQYFSRTGPEGGHGGEAGDHRAHGGGHGGHSR